MAWVRYLASLNYICEYRGAVSIMCRRAPTRVVPGAPPYPARDRHRKRSARRQHPITGRKTKCAHHSGRLAWAVVPCHSPAPIQRYLKEVPDADRYRPDHCPQRGTARPCHLQPIFSRYADGTGASAGGLASTCSASATVGYRVNTSSTLHVLNSSRMRSLTPARHSRRALFSNEA